MKAIDIDTSIIDGYLKLLDNLSPENKLDLISRLTLTIKADIIDRKNNFKKSFGAFDSKLSADDIIEDLKVNRNFNRKIESL